jgi:hypothetical protein
MAFGAEIELSVKWEIKLGIKDVKVSSKFVHVFWMSSSGGWLDMWGWVRSSTAYDSSRRFASLGARVIIAFGLVLLRIFWKIVVRMLQ